jgi:YHS domain-containing protein
MVRRFFQGKAPSAPQAPAQIQDEMVQDPVCLTYVPKRMAVTVNTPREGALYFCSPACRDKFLEGSSGKRKKEKS